jgi:hypothetical protein
MRKFLALMIVGLSFLFISMVAFAQQVELPVQDFFAQVLEAVKGFGGLSWGMKVGVVITILISSMKVSLIRQWTWDKVPASMKVLVAPGLALIAGIVSVGKWDAPSLMAWVLAGGGAILIDNLLAGVKEIPNVGPKYLRLINFISGILRKPAK